MHLVATSFDATKTVPADADVVLAFDRLLSPSSVTRQSVALRDAFGQAPSSPIVVYDPVTRTVTLSSPMHDGAWLLENQPYKLVIGVPKDTSDIGGLRAIDGATLQAPVVLEFLTTKAAGRAASPKVSYCADVAPRLASACGSCHGASTVDATMGLSLTSAAGVAATAVNQASRELASGARVTPQAPSRAFGVGMPLVTPGDPGNSYLVYKLLAWGEPVASGSPSATAGRLHAPLSQDEAARLRGLVVGQAMPPDAPRLDFRDVANVSAWIAQGASLDCP